MKEIDKIVELLNAQHNLQNGKYKYTFYTVLIRTNAFHGPFFLSFTINPCLIFLNLYYVFQWSFLKPLCFLLEQNFKLAKVTLGFMDWIEEVPMCGFFVANQNNQWGAHGVLNSFKSTHYPPPQMWWEPEDGWHRLWWVSMGTSWALFRIIDSSILFFNVKSTYEFPFIYSLFCKKLLYLHFGIKFLH